MRLLLAALGLLLITAAPARAGTWHGSDPAGDVDHYTFNPDPEPCGTSTDETVPADTRHDLTRLGVDHRADTIELRLDLRKVSAHDADTFYVVTLRTPKHDYELDLSRRRAGAPLDGMLSKAPHVPESTGECGAFATLSRGLPCDELVVHGDVRRDRVEVSLPRSCVKGPRWVQVGAQVYGFDAYDGHTVSGYQDTWSEGASADLLVPLGPRVRRG